MKQKRVYIVFALLFASLCPAPLVSAQGRPTISDVNEVAVSRPMLKHLEFNFMPLEDAVAILMEKIGGNYALDCGLQNVLLPPLTIDNMEQGDAVRLLVKASGRSVGCYHDEQHNIYVLEGHLDDKHPTRTIGKVRRDTGRVTVFTPKNEDDPIFVDVDVKNGSLHTTLKQLFEGAHIKYFMEQRLKQIPITAKMRHVNFNIALGTLVGIADAPKPLTYKVEGGVYSIIEKPKFEEAGPGY